MRGYLLSVLVFFSLIFCPIVSGQQIIVDDFSDDCELIGVWADNRSNGFSDAGTYNRGYHYTSSHEPFRKTGKEKAIWHPKFPKAGGYKVEVSFRASASNRSSKVTYEVKHRDGTIKKQVNQKDGEDMTWVVLGTFSFEAGKSGTVAIASDGGQSAVADAAKFTFIKDSGGQSSDLDNVLGNSPDDRGSPDSPVTPGTSDAIELNKNNTGSKTFTFSADGKVKITAKLSTWHPASLKVILKKADGTKEDLMSWERQNDTDPGPLHVKGKAVEDSMSEVKPGDFSPNATTRIFEGKKGDSIVLKLVGKFGNADSILSLTPVSGSSDAADSTDSSTGGSPGKTGKSPTIESQKVTSGGALITSIPFDKPWTINYSGNVTSTSGFARILAGGGETVHNRRIDLWTPGGRGLHFRLANKRIFFSSAAVGSINNPDGESDHFLKTTVSSVGGNFKLQIRNNSIENRVQVFWNGKLVGDGTYKIKDLPFPQTALDFPASEGDFSIEVGSL